MKIKALAPWYGGKRNLAPLIVEELGEHRVYWEPFCGSMAPLLAKPPCSMETVNDLNGHLVNLARVVRDPKQGPQLYRRLRRTLMAEEFLRESVMVCRQIEAQQLELDPVEHAYHYFIMCWLGRNGTAGQPANKTGALCVRYTANGGHAATRWRSAVHSMPAWRRRLAGVDIANRDGFEMLARIEDARGTAIYCDPPYLAKAGRYLHDFRSKDHGRLAKLLHRFEKARVVVSYYEHPQLVELYPGWTQVKIEVAKALSRGNQLGAPKDRVVEVLLINGPSITQGQAAATEAPLFG